MTASTSAPQPDDGTLPQLRGAPFVTDGGMETDLIFRHGVDLPEFAAFPLLDTAEGRALLTGYYDDYAAIADRAGAGLLLEAPTWRANPDWGARLGYDLPTLTRINTDAVRFLARLRERYASAPGVAPILVGGVIGPRADGYRAEDRLGPTRSAEYHRAQIEAFAAAGADLATAYTLTHPDEAIGITRAARSVGLPVAISFTVETDGRLPDGNSIAQAISTVDQAEPPDYYLVNCAHPQHIHAGIDAGPDQYRPWTDRIIGLRVNASQKSHAELDAATELDEGDRNTLVASQSRLSAALPGVTVLGGCCGTDRRHVAALWTSRTAHA